MRTGTQVSRWVLAALFAITWVYGIPLLFFLDTGLRWHHWGVMDPTGMKALGAALVAIGIGSLLAARDPYRHRIMVQTDIVFTTLTALGILYRQLWGPGWTPSSAWYPFAFAATFAVLLSVFYPLRQEN